MSTAHTILDSTPSTPATSPSLSRVRRPASSKNSPIKACSAKARNEWSELAGCLSDVVDEATHAFDDGLRVHTQTVETAMRTRLVATT
jgi:hypothetical protein